MEFGFRNVKLLNVQSVIINEVYVARTNCEKFPFIKLTPKMPIVELSTLRNLKFAEKELNEMLQFF